MQRKNLIIIILIILAVAIITIFIVFKYLIKPTGPLIELDNPDCTSDTYNCDDFPTYESAKAVFDFCFDDAGDIHRLDADGNGVPCEGLLG